MAEVSGYFPQEPRLATFFTYQINWPAKNPLQTLLKLNKFDQAGRLGKLNQQIDVAGSWFSTGNRPKQPHLFDMVDFQLCSMSAKKNRNGG
jgi:hypothetical protein